MSLSRVASSRCCGAIGAEGSRSLAARSSGTARGIPQAPAVTPLSALRHKVTEMERHDGYFAPDGVAWRVGRETALLLGGGRALLLQVAHPLVAAGVAAHSDYRENPWRRLEQTMSTVWTVIYGTRSEADAAVSRVRAVHERVRGRIAAPMGPFAEGTRYSALDPEL